MALALSFAGHIADAGRLYMSGFLSLGIGIRKSTLFKGFTYTQCIFAAVTAAIYYPHYFVECRGFKLASLITPLIALIMFGMGTSMSLRDFAGVAKMPKGIFIGVFSHFLIIPLIGYVLANISRFPPEIAAGVI